MPDVYSSLTGGGGHWVHQSGSSVGGYPIRLRPGSGDTPAIRPADAARMVVQALEVRGILPSEPALRAEFLRELSAALQPSPTSGPAPALPAESLKVEAIRDDDADEPVSPEIVQAFLQSLRRHPRPEDVVEEVYSEEELAGWY